VGRRPPNPRLRYAALCAALVLATSACTVPAGFPGAPVPSAAVTADARTIALRLSDALSRRNQDTFLTVFSAEPEDQAVGRSWYAVLSAGEASVEPAAPDLLRVSYRLPGDRGQATEVVAFQLAQGSERISWVRSVGEGLPLWSLPGVVPTRAASGTLVSGGLDARSRTAWAARLDRAADAVRRSGVTAADTTLGERWGGGLVVEVPPAGRFGEVTGESATNASAITSCKAGTPRVVVNPVVLGQPDAWLDSTLVHEAVHVATGSACVTAGVSVGWVVEGVAESVAQASDPATDARNRSLVRTYLRAHGVPAALPERLETLTDYALAALAVEEVRSHLGSRADDFLRTGIHEGASLTRTQLDSATKWYIAELLRRARSG
jgi:hypothetical protein